MLLAFINAVPDTFEKTSLKPGSLLSTPGKFCRHHINRVLALGNVDLFLTFGVEQAKVNGL
jgi:hypothetical protein